MTDVTKATVFTILSVGGCNKRTLTANGKEYSMKWQQQIFSLILYNHKIKMCPYKLKSGNTGVGFFYLYSCMFFVLFLFCSFFYPKTKTKQIPWLQNITT